MFNEIVAVAVSCLSVYRLALHDFLPCYLRQESSKKLLSVLYVDNKGSAIIRGEDIKQDLAAEPLYCFGSISTDCGPKSIEAIDIDNCRQPESFFRVFVISQ